MIHNDELNSSYPILEKPLFNSKLPSHLLSDQDEKTKYVLEKLDIMIQQNEWLIKAAIDTNEQVRKTNGRLKTLESWKEDINLEELKKDVELSGQCLENIVEWKDDMKNIKENNDVLNMIRNFWAIVAFIVGAIGSVGAALVYFIK
jgi:hypothetical protein